MKDKEIKEPLIINEDVFNKLKMTKEDIIKAWRQTGAIIMPELKRVRAIQDSDGHWYIVPNDMYDEFCEDLDACDDDGFIGQDLSFDSKWSGYMTGGDLNSVQLWA